MKPTPWDQALKLEVIRQDDFGDDCVLEPGVNYFVLKLEQLGCVTRWSCEGHPDGFYVAFEAPYEVALRISGCGYFTVEILHDRKNYWAIRLPPQANDEDRKFALGLASISWERRLLPQKKVLPANR